MVKGKKSSLVVMCLWGDDRSMYDIHCPHCEARWLVSSRAIRSMHNTSDGPLAYVECPKGHLLMRYFRDARTESAPVAAVAS